MKNLTKIFMAVVAGMLAFACTTDATEDLGVQVGNGENGGATVELSLSLEESRTQLGEKVDGLYPLHWSEGDKISVNGVESGEAIINKENPASAVFAVTEAETYAVAYPAAPAGKVLFAEKQNHVVAGNTFASGVSTMYGYGVDRSNIQLNHLTGVLKIGIKGEAILSKAQISTVDRAPIAGTFDIDFQTGELTATTASKEVIEYSFGESGLQLTADAQYIHVAVPAGEYDELYITLYEKGNSGNIMYATVKAGESKPLVAGNVREFKNAIVYAPNAQLYVIDSVEKLVAFKAAVEAEGGLEMDAIFTEDIDMTGVEWTPIAGENYTNTIHGNGYAIKGLTAPLFGTLSASVKGLHLKDVALVTNNTQYMGAIACVLDAKEGFAPKIENCSVSGTLTVKNPDYKVTDSSNQSLRYGGIAGYSNSIAIDNCVNNIDFTVEQVVSEANDGASLETQVCVAGMIGAGYKTTSELSNVTNCVNNGTITYSDKFASATNKARAWVAGIIGSMNSSNDGALLNDNTNNGDITVSTVLLGGTSYIAGIAGYASATNKTGYINNCKNYGAISLTGSKNGTAWLAGIIAYGVGTQADNTHNYGAISIGSKDNPTLFENQKIYVGGIACRFTDAEKGEKADATTTNVSNNAPITIWTAEGSYGGTYRIAGVISWSQGSFTNVKNNAGGDITLNGYYELTSTSESEYCIGGIVGYKTSNSGKECENSGDITVNTVFTSASTLKDSDKQYLYIGGFVGRSHQVMKGTNYGTINIGGDTSGATKATMFVGGCLGYTDGGEQGNINRQQINITGKHRLAYIGGVVGYTGGNMADHQNYGAINVSSENTGNTYVAGVCAGVNGYLSNSHNEGDIAVTGTVTGESYICGVTGDVGTYISDCYNEGDITISGTSAKAAICGLSKDVAGNVSNCYNTGNLTYSGTSNGGGINMYGLFYTAAGEVSNCYNGEKDSTTKGSINYTSTANISTVSMGGIAYKMSNNATNVVNYGPINMTGNSGNSLYIGGIARSFVAAGYTWTECVNHGDITISGIVGDETMSSSSSDADAFVGGISDTANAGSAIESVVRCQNHGDITFTETFKCANAIRTSCFLARPEYDGLVLMEDCWNSGNFTFQGVGSNRKAGNFKAGGCFGGASKGSMIIKGHLINSGNVSVSGDLSKVSGIVIGGTFGNSAIAISLAEGETEALIANTGKVSFSGSSKSDTYIGGISGTVSKAVAEGISFVNTGDVEVTGTFTGAGTSHIGGVIGKLTMPINAKSYCTVNAVDYQNVGMITGSAYAAGTTEVKAGGIGGTMITMVLGEEWNDPYAEDYKITIYGPGAITEDNKHQCIYGSEVSAEVAAACEVLAAAPTVTLPAKLPVTE